MPIKLVCDNCGKIFYQVPSYINGKKHLFCSQNCSHDYTNKKVKLACDNCGKVIYRKLNQVKKHKHFFCCRKCLYEWRHKNRITTRKVDLICENCGESYQVGQFFNDPKKGRKSRFCSRKCQSEMRSKEQKGKQNSNYSQRIKRICPVCKKEFEVTTYYKNRNEMICCSSKCRGQRTSQNMRGKKHHNWKGGGDPYYGGNWCQQRNAARKRDNHTCQNCGFRKKIRALPVHHIVSLRKFNGDWKRANQLSNLITLCQKCHGGIESGKIKL